MVEHCVLLDNRNDPDLRIGYARKTIECGWSQDVLDTRTQTACMNSKAGC